MNFNDLATSDLFDYVYDAEYSISLVREGILSEEELKLMLDDETNLIDIRPILIEAANAINKVDGWSYEEYVGDTTYDPEDEFDD